MDRRNQAQSKITLFDPTPSDALQLKRCSSSWRARTTQFGGEPHWKNSLLGLRKGFMVRRNQNAWTAAAPWARGMK
jgi:hypothetical protein